MSRMNRARRAIERLYIGRCDVIERQGVPDPVTKITKQTEVPIQVGLPCRLSHERLTAASDASPAATVAQGIKVFLASEIPVKPGSKLVITQHDVTTAYQQSGMPAVKSNHQEIMLELFKGWA